MGLNVDDEILSDFLVEASEILEQLGEQLVDLEQRPQDMDLLNAVFRGFHTIKGGAGFLNLEPLVAVCHRAEDVFNLLRNGERQVDAQLMDVILPVVDVLNVMFGNLRAGDEPEPADPTLLANLEALLSAEPAPAAAVQPPASAPEPVEEAVTANAGDPADEGDITDDEFEALLDALQSEKTGAAAPAAAAPATPSQPAPSAGDDITDDEFEALLDNLHGKGQFGAAPSAAGGAQATPAPATPPPAAAVEAAKSGGDEITEEEFEALLDELHGAGTFKGASQSGASEQPMQPAKPAAKVAPVAQSAAAKPAAPAAKDKKAEAPAAQAETTVRVDTKRLDDIMNMVGELVLARNRLARIEASMANEEMAKAVANLDLVTTDLQMAVMKTRMQPIKKVFGRFPRVVRDLARSLKKEIKLELQGEETDLDKNLVEALADPLVHLVRNAVDHGIEAPEVREAAGKPRAGTVMLAAEQEGDHILLTIEDDGGGMDADVLRRKAVEKGLYDTDAAARLDDNECFNLIFMPGFSTKSEISDISGRGVGMDVVKTRISQLNGTINIDSVLGKGTRLTIKVPLTLAIMPTLMVKLGEQMFALPLVNVSEIFHLDLTRTNTVDGQLAVMVREHALPVFYLTRWLVKGNGGATLPTTGHVVVVHVGTQRVGFVVDGLIGQEEVVIKPLGAFLHGLRGLAGATITGDGGIAIILDVPGLMKAYARRV